MTEDANPVNNTDQPTWEYGGKQLPLFPFDQPQTVRLPNGTIHQFKAWDATIEKHRENLLKTVIVTSPHQINGESPRDARTDYTRSMLYYYRAMIDKVGGVEYNGNGPDDLIDASTEIDGTVNGKPARIIDAIGAPIQRLAASRLYTGQVDVERPEGIEPDEVDEDFDPFADPKEVDIEAELAKAEAKKSLYKLALNRDIAIVQKFGVEVRNGREGDPTHVVRHTFLEPDGDDFSKWELKSMRGYAIDLNKGGSRAERYYNLDTISQLYARLIDRIEGASINGLAIDLPTDRDDPSRVALIAKIPLLVKRSTVIQLFTEMSTLGNS